MRAAGQTAAWGYAFVGHGIYHDASVVATSFERDFVTPTSVAVYRCVESAVQWGAGVEWQFYEGLAVGAEAGALHQVDEPAYPGGALAVNLAYRFGALERSLVPFITGGYSFGLDTQHGFDAGAGVDHWFDERTGVAPRIQRYGLKHRIEAARWPEPYEWVLAFRVGLNFTRGRF